MQAPKTPLRVGITLLLVGLALPLVSPAAAQDNLEAKAIQDGQEAWAPPAPRPTGREWLQLDSGEWLMGDLKTLRVKDLVFDSEDLGQLKLDWDDVTVLRTPRVLTFVFEDKIILSGTGLVKDGEVTVDVRGVEHRMPRSRLIGIIDGPPREINYWSGSLSIGFVGRSGNTNQSDLNTLITIKREATLTRLVLSGAGNFGENSGEQNVNNQRVSAVMDFFVYRNLFLTVPSLEYYSDAFQNIDYRLTGGAGFGYFLFRDSDLEWSVSLGGGYQDVEYVSVEEGTDPADKTGTVIPSTALDWDLTGALELKLEYNARIGIPDTSNTYHHLLVLLGVEIWNDDLSLETSLTWDRNESPRPDADGVVPKPDDLRVYFGFGLEI